MKPLSPKRQRFVDEYLLDFNSARAARAAGYAEKTARTQGSQLLTYLDVQVALLHARERSAKKLDVRIEHVLAGLLREGNKDLPVGASSARVAAWATISKMLGFDAPRKVELMGANGGAVKIEQKWTEEEVWARFKRVLDGGAVDSLRDANGKSAREARRTNGAGAS